MTSVRGCRRGGPLPQGLPGTARRPREGTGSRTHLSARSCWARAMVVGAPGEKVERVFTGPGPGRVHLSLTSSHPVSLLWSQESPGASAGEAPPLPLSLRRSPSSGLSRSSPPPTLPLPHLPAARPTGEVPLLDAGFAGIHGLGGFEDFLDVISWCRPPCGIRELHSIGDRVPVLARPPSGLVNLKSS